MKAKTWTGNAAVLLVWTAMAIVPCSGGDWPMWRGPDGSGVGRGCGQPLVDDLAEMRLVWRSEEREIPANTWHNGTQGGYDSPIVANGKVFLSYFKGTGDLLDADVLGCKDSASAGPEWAKVNAKVVTEDTVLCVDAKTGKTLWKTVLGEGINLFNMRKGGPHSGACWSKGKVYAQSTLGRVYCLNDADGKVVWQADVPTTTQQTKVLEGYRKAGHIHAYRGKNPVPELDAVPLPLLYMWPLCVADGVVAADGGAFDCETGRPLAGWKNPPTFIGAWNRTRTLAPLRWECDGKEYFIIGNRCVAPKTGATVWQVKEADPGGTPAIGDGHLVALYTGDKGGFVCCKIDAKGYKVVWTNTEYRAVLLAPSAGVIVKGWFFAAASGPKGTMHPDRPMVRELAVGFELATGKRAGPVSFTGESQCNCTSPVGMDGRWFFHVGAGMSGMVMVNMDGADFREVGLRVPTVRSGMTTVPENVKKRKKLDYCLASTPAVADGFMYFRGSDCLWCYDMRRPSEEDLAKMRQARQQEAAKFVADYRAGRATLADTVQELVGNDLGTMAEPLVLEDLRKALEARDATKFGAIAAVSASLGRSSSSTLGPIVNRALASGNADLALAAMTASHALVDSEAAKAKPVLAAFLDAPDSRFWGPASGMLCAIDSDGGKTILQAMSRFDRKSNVAAVLAAIQVIRAVAERAGDGVARKATVPALTRFLRHADVSCQKAAITALAALGPDARNAIGELEEVATELPDMEEAIKAALGRIDPSRNEAPKVEADLPPLDL